MYDIWKHDNTLLHRIYRQPRKDDYNKVYKSFLNVIENKEDDAMNEIPVVLL